MVKDLHQNSVARNAQALDVQGSLKALNPREVSTQNPKIQEILTREIRDFNQDLQIKRQSIGEGYWKMLEQGNVNSKSVAAAFERDEYNRCLLRYVGDIEQFGNSVRNPTVSDAANSSRDLLLKTTIKENLRDNNIHIKQKIKNIQKEDIPGEKIRISASRNVCGKSLYGGQLIGVTQLMKLYECECDRVYKDRSEGSIAASTVANHIESFDKYIKDKKKAFATQVHRKLDKELLRCPADTSTGVAKSSCNGALDKTSNNFCLRTAKVCAGNAKACLATANKKRVQTRNEQKQKAAIYKTRMAALKQTLQGEFKKQEQLIEMSSRTLDQQYGVGSVYNVPLELELNQSDDQLLGDLDASLLIEDPKAYLAAAQADIKKAKEKLEESNKEIFGSDPGQFKGRVEKGMIAGGGFLGRVAGYIENVEIEQKRWSDIQQQCKETMMAISQGMEQAKQGQMQTAQMCEQAKAFKGPDPCLSASSGLANFSEDLSNALDANNGGNVQSKIAQHCQGQDRALEEIETGNLESQVYKLKKYCEVETREGCQNLVICKSYADRLAIPPTDKFCLTDTAIEKMKDTTTCEKSDIKEGATIEGMINSEDNFEKYKNMIGLNGSCKLPSEVPQVAKAAYLHSVNESMLNSALSFVNSDACNGIQITEARTGEKDTGNYGIGRYLGSLYDGLGGGTLKK